MIYIISDKNILIKVKVKNSNIIYRRVINWDILSFNIIFVY